MNSADAVHCALPKKKYFSGELENFMEDESFETAV